MNYSEQNFNLPELSGLSQKQLEIHLKLYSGYVKNVNAILNLLADLKKDSVKNSLAIAEITRRFSFEYNGMRLHELYFSALGGNGQITESSLKQALVTQYGSIENFLTEFKNTGLMRGIGWTLLVLDQSTKNLHITWVSDHEIGHLADSKTLIAMDMWEHAFLVDYVPAQKNEYIEAFFKNINWSVIEKRFES